MEVILKERAQRSIIRITKYIFDKGYPENAIKFAKRLEHFSLSLGLFSKKHFICRQKYYAKFDFRCVPFESNYIFIYKIYADRVVVHNIVHVSNLRN